MAVKPTRFDVRWFETDPQGRLTLPALCAYLQEAARRNADQLDAGQQRLSRDGLAWVLHRLRIEVERLPRLDEQVTVDTWPCTFDLVTAERDFEVHGPDGRRLAAATSLWAVVDLQRRRMARLPEFVRALSPPARARALRFPGPEPPPPTAAQLGREIEVRRADLDMVRHANNTRYVEWALEPLPEDCLDGHLAAFEIVFKRESVQGDRLVSRAQRASASNGAVRYSHAVVRPADGAVLAHASSLWRAREAPAARRATRS